MSTEYFKQKATNYDIQRLFIRLLLTDRSNITVKFYTSNRSYITVKFYTANRSNIMADSIQQYKLASSILATLSVVINNVPA